MAVMPAYIFIQVTRVVICMYVVTCRETSRVVIEAQWL